MKINYSVVIRTIGNAGEKYKCLLKSIENLYPRPNEIIVVLPKGYDIPNERIGSGLKETFIFSKKGMVEQRLTGIEASSSEYLLVCDDDVSFDSDFVQKLYKPLKQGIARISAGPLLSFLPEKGIKSLYNSISFGAIQTVFNKDKYCHILKSSGWSYNRNINIDEECYYVSESLPWTCFFAEKKALEEINLREEIWLDKNGYASMDDQTMFYKAYLKNIKTVVVSNAIYQHLDAKTSTKNKSDNIILSTSFNRVVFWHRFILTRKKNVFYRLICLISFLYYVLMKQIYLSIKSFKNEQNKHQNEVYRRGLKEGIKYLKSEEYKKLEEI